MAIRVKRVDPAKPATAALLQWLQLEVLPADAPMPTDEGYWWVAYADDTPVGFAGLRSSSQFANCGYLCRAGVLPKMRGRGVQKRMIQARVNYARRLGWQWLLTDTANHNSPSANALIACGFRLYTPSAPWGLPGANYWRKKITLEEKQDG